MNDKEIKKIIEGAYDKSEEDSLLSLVGELYSKKMFPSFVAHFLYGVPFLAGAIFCGIKFSKTDQTQLHIMYAAIFICCIEFCIFSKAKYWQMLYKINISREIKRLELRIAELNETVKNK